MAKTLAYATQKWERKTANAGGRWKAAVEGAGSRYCEGFQQFLGHPAPQACAAFTAGVGAVSAAEFQGAIAGKGGKYAEALQRVS